MKRLIAFVIQMWAHLLRTENRSRLVWQWITQRALTRRNVLIKLIQDVNHLGKQGDIVYVKPGHMRHDLYPTKKAVYALATDKPSLQAKKERVTFNPTNEQLVKFQLKQVINRLISTPLKINIASKDNIEKETSVAITREVLSHYIKRKMRIDLSPTLLHLDSPIVASGEYQIPLNFIHDNKRDLNIQLKVEQTSENN